MAIATTHIAAYSLNTLALEYLERTRKDLEQRLFERESVSLAHFGACLGRAGVPIDCVIPHCVR